MESNKDPLGLWNGAEQKAPPSAQQKTGGLRDILWAVAIAGILLAGWQYRDRISGGEGGDDPRPAPVSVEGKTLVFLHERDPQPIEHDELLREMPEWCAKHNLQFRSFDDDITDQPIPKLLAWALTKGVSPPLVILTDKDNRPAKVSSWPESLEKLEAWVK